MDSQTIRTILGELQQDPDRSKPWAALKEAAQVEGGDLSLSDGLRLLASARHAHQGRDEWQAVARLLAMETELASSTPDEHALLAEQARVLQEELYDEPGAVAAYGRILELAPGDPTATEAVADSQGRQARWQELCQTYLDEASSAPDEVYKGSMLMRAAEMELRFAGGDTSHDRVVDRLTVSAQLDPTNDRAAKMLDVVYHRLERWADLAKFLEWVFTKAPEPARRVGVGIQLARLRRNHLDDAAGMADAYRRVLTIDSSNSEAMEQLSEHYSREERWDDLVALYEKSVEGKDLASPENLGEVLQIAMLHWRKREKPIDAEEWFENLRKMNPAFPAALAFFREYCTETGDTGRLLSVLQAAQRSVPEGDEKQALAQEIAGLAEEQKDAQRAVEQYKSMLRQNPDDAEARDKLKELYRQTQGYNALVELLRQELDRVDESEAEQRLEILREVASVYRQFIKSDTALVSVLNQIVAVDENDVEAIRELIGLYEKLQRWRDLLANQQKLAELTEDASTKAELYRAIGRRWLDQFSNVQNAIGAFEALLEALPGDPEAVENLTELYKKRRAWPQIFALYESQLDRVTGIERVNMMREMAQIAAERLRKGDVAGRLYKRILEAEPDNAEVLDAMEKQAERAKDWPTLAEALERRAEVTADDGQRLAVLQKLGAVYADHINDPQGAIGAWRRVLELQPGHHRALRVLREAYLSAGDYDGLEELYASQSDWDGLADVLSTTADRAKEPEVKVELSYRAAAVYIDRLDQPDRAFRSYERILAVAPDDTKAARGLIPLYEADEKFNRLPALYELIVEKADDDAEKLDYLQKLIEVSGTRLNDRAGAAKYARQAYEIAPDSESTLTAFEDACRSAGAWDLFVESVGARVAAAEGDDERALQIKLAQVYATELGRVDEAIQTYKQLVEAQPDDESAASALDGILRREGRKDDLRWLFGTRTESAASDDERVRLLGEWADLEETVFEDPAAAAGLYRKILEVDETVRAALVALPRLLLAADDMAGAVVVIESHRDQADGADRADLEVQLAELYLGPLARSGDALEAAVRALELSQHDKRAIAVLEKLVDVEATKERAAEVLAAEYADMGDASQEAEALGAMLQAAEDPSERLGLYNRLADVHEEKLESYDAALGVMLRAVVEFSGELDLWERARSLATLAGKPGQLSGAYEKMLQAELDAGVQLELCEQAAQLHEDVLGDPVGAAPFLERTLALDPGNGNAFGRLKQILTGAEKWEALEALYERTTAATDDPLHKAEMLAEVAMVCEEIIEDYAKATSYYERILEIDPVHDGAMTALERLYEDQERFADLASLLERRLTTAIGDASFDLKLRLGRILLDRLDKPESAVDHIEDVLRDRPNDYDARTLAEKLLRSDSLKFRAAEMLEAVYEARDEVRDLVGVLEIRMAGLEARAAEGESGLEEEQKELLRRIATLRDSRLRDDAGAMDALARYVPLDPIDEEARQRLLEIGGRLGEQARIAEVLEAAAGNADTAGMQGEILMQAAGIYEDRLGDTGRAEATYKKVLELGTDDPELALPAARALERVYAAADNHELLADMLRRQIRLEEDTDARMALQARLGSLRETALDDPSGAVEAWKARLDESPGDAAALEALDRLYERTEQWRDLVEVLESRQERTDDADARGALLRRMAVVQAERLGVPEEAIDTWRSIVADVGPSTEAYRALEQLLAKTEQWDDLGDTYLSHLDVVEDQEERLDLLARLGTLRADRLSDTEGALETYRDALTIDPGHAPSRAALEKLLEADDPLTRRDAAAILHPIYEGEGDNERLLRVLDVEVGAVEDPLAKLDGLQKALRVADGPLGDAGRAFEYAKAALRQAAGHTALDGWLGELDRLAGVTGKHSEQIALLREVVDEIFDGDVQFTVTFQIASLARDHAGDPDLAREYFQKALELKPEDRDAMVALEELYAKGEEVGSLLEILERRTDATESESERKELLFRRAALLSEQVADAVRATEVYEAILDIDLDPQAVSALERLYADQERWDDLVALYQRMLDQPGSSAADLHVKIAKVAATNQGDAIRAFDEIEMALDIDRQHAGAIEALEAVLVSDAAPEDRGRAAALLEPIYLVRADYDKVMRTIQARLDSSEDPEERHEMLTRLAQLYEEQKEDYGAALETVAKLLHEDIDSSQTIHELERLAKVAGAERRLAEIYAAELEQVETDEPGTASLAKRTGELYAELGEAEKGLTFYRRALAFDPESAELFEAVDRLLERLERHQDRVDLYQAGLDYRYDDAEKTRMLHTIADLLRRELEQPDEAIETYRAALDIDETDATSLDALSELYSARERWDDLAELLTRRAETADGPVDAAQHRLALARLLEKQLESPERAIDQLEEIVRALPSNTEAVAALEAFRDNDDYRERVVDILRPIYEDSDDWRRVIKLNEDRFDLAEDPAEKVSVLRETAELWEQRGSDAGRARRALSVAVELDADDADVRADYERLVAETEAWDELAELYEVVLEDEELLSRRDILAKVALVHDEQRDDPRRALQAYLSLRDVDEGELETLERIEMLATLLSDWRVLVGVLTQKADVVIDDETRASIWRRVGETRRDMLDEPEGAIEAYRRAQELDPESTVNVDALIELFQAKEAPEDLVELYQRRVDLASQDEDELKYGLLMSAAEVLEQKLEDRSRAIEVLNRALEVRAGEPEILTALNRLYRAEEMWPDLLDNLRLEASSAETPERRAELRREIAGILAQQLESYHEALEAYQLVLDELPDDESARTAVKAIGQEHEGFRSMAARILVPVLRLTERHEELVEVLEMRLTTETEPGERADTLRTVAEVLEEHLKKPSEAEDALLRALVEQPEAADLYTSIERLADATTGWGRYADALEQRAQNTFDSDLARDLYTRLGRAAELKLEDDERAVAAYVRAVEQAGDQPDLLEALDRLYARLGKSEQLLDVIERRIGVAENDGDEAEMHYRKAVVQITELENKEHGLQSLRTAIDKDIAHEGASEELEGLADDPQFFDEAFETLEAVYRSRGQNERLALLYDKRVAHAGNPDERAGLRRDLAKVLEDEVGDPSAAQRLLQEGFADDPADQSLIDEVARLAGTTGNWEGAAAALRDAVLAKKGELGADRARDISVQVALWYRDRAEDSEHAEQAFVVAHEFDPKSDEVLIEIESLQGASGREKDLVETLRRRARLQGESEVRDDLYKRAKELADGQTDRELAEAVLRELLDQDDDNAWALAELTDLREAAEDFEETYALLVKRMEHSEHDGQVRELAHKAAGIAREKLGAPDKAIDLYRKLFEGDATDTGASGALRELFATAERFRDLGDVLRRLVEVSEESVERCTLRMELAVLQEERFDAPEEAIETLSAVLGEDPNRSEAVESLTRLYESAGKFDKLAALLSEQVSLAGERGDAARELEFQVRLGEVYDARMGDREGAIKTYNAVLERNPEHRGALEALARLHQSGKEHELAAAVLEKLVDLSDGGEARELCLTLAAEYEAFDDKERAASALERGLALDEGNTELRDRLRKLYEDSGAWEKLAGLVAGDAEAAEGNDDKIRLLRKAADIHQQKRQDAGAAAALLEKAKELAPEDRDILLDLCDAYSASGRAEAAIAALEEIVDSYGGKRSKELGEIHRRLSRAHLSAGATEKALEELDKAFRIEPGNVLVLKELGEVSLQSGDLKKAQQMYRALLLQKLDESSPITKAEVFFSLGRVHHELGEKPKAIQMLERAIQTDDALETAKALLAEIKG